MRSKENKNKEEYCDIVLTDIQGHVQKPRKPVSWNRAISKCLKNKKPGRFYTENTVKNKVTFNSINDFTKTLKELEKKTGKKVRIFVPKNGLPIIPGKDTLEKLKANKKKKRKPLTRTWKA